jgi:uncharacterized protein YdeI (YjbR/CyaY-like superfamily)
MKKTDPRIDAYIASSADFARPILRHLRKLIHKACPSVEETMKWSSPHFMHHGILCGMAAFKHHCAINFWKGRLLFGDSRPEGPRTPDAMGQFGRITSLQDLPKDETFIKYARAAAKLNETGVGTRRASRSRRPAELPVPEDLQLAMKTNPNALSTFEKFSPSHRKEYIEWITEAKREVTRKRRLATTIEWLAAGKRHNWRYEKC